MNASPDQPRMTAIDCLTQGVEAWFYDADLAMLALAREGGLAITLPHSCRHSESHKIAPPASLRRLCSTPCSRCLLAQEGEP